MAQRTYPRPDAHHAVTAGNVLARHEGAVGRAVELPVPIDLIIEQTYGLTLLWDEIIEPPNTMILGALFPQEKQIVMNTRHEEFFGRVIGPERFTLAHELGHWIYDADSPDQLTLDLSAGPAEQFCYHRQGPALPDDLRVREMNANKFASHLLMPEGLVRAADIDEVLDNFRETAASWGVSQQALGYRLRSLKLIDDVDAERLQLDLG